MTTDLEKAQTFLNSLFGDKDDIDDNQILIWAKNPPPRKGGLSHWFKGDQLELAAKFAASFNGDVYFSVGLSPKNYGDRRRCLQEDISGIGGFWIDVDIAHDVHQKSNLPPDIDAAMGLLKGYGFNPSIILQSGHGLQAYWIFKEVWLFDGEKDRHEARALSQRMVNTIRNRAKEKGWTVDGVANLDRLMRLPGTYNCKNPDKKKPVKILEQHDLRYNPEDFEEILDEGTFEILPGGRRVECTPPGTGDQAELNFEPISIDELDFDEKAEPNPAKLAILKDLDEKFAATWERQRDLPDDSPSGYHMALIWAAVKAGWEDQEIIDLLIAWNRRHKITLEKLMTRPRYSILAIEDVRKKHSMTAGDKLIQEHQQIRESKHKAGDDEVKESARQGLKMRLGIDVLKVVKYLGDKCTYEVVLPDTRIVLPGIEHISSPTKFHDAFADHTGKALPHFKKKDWQPIEQCLLDLRVEVNVAKEMSLTGQVELWLRDYLENKSRLDKNAGAPTKEPYYHDGHWYIFSDTFFTWTKEESFNNDFSARKICLAFHKLKLTTKEIKVNTGAGRISRRPWKIPKHITAPPAPDSKEIVDGGEGEYEKKMPDDVPVEDKIVALNEGDAQTGNSDKTGMEKLEDFVNEQTAINDK